MQTPCFAPSSQDIVLCFGQKISVYSSSTFELKREFESSPLDIITHDTPYTSNDDANTLFVHRLGQKDVQVYNIQTGAKELKPFPNQDDETFFIYQGMSSKAFLHHLFYRHLTLVHQTFALPFIIHSYFFYSKFKQRI